MDFTDQVVVINDASHSIGRAAALMMAQRGARLALGYSGDASAATVLATHCRDLRGQDAVLVCPVMHDRREGIDGLIEQTLDRWGQIDSIINCGSITPVAPITRLTYSQWRQTLATQLDPTFFSTQAVLRPMMRQRHGRIVTLVSLFGLAGGIEMTDFSAAMGGLIGLTRAAARELAPWNITVNAVAQGLIESVELAETMPQDFVNWGQQFISLRRLGRPDEAASAICFLASSLASYITGQVLTVDGGFRIAP